MSYFLYLEFRQPSASACIRDKCSGLLSIHEQVLVVGKDTSSVVRKSHRVIIPILMSKVRLDMKGIDP